MHDEALLEQIREYIRANRGTYTIEALRERLIRDGVPADAVGRVLVEMTGTPQGAAGQPPPPSPPGSPYLGPAPNAPPPAAGRQWSIGTIFALVVGVVLLNLGVLALAVYLFVETYQEAYPVLVCAAALVAEIAAAILIARRNKSVSVGVALGIFVTPAVVMVLLLGTCIYIISQY